MSNNKPKKPANPAEKLTLVREMDSPKYDYQMTISGSGSIGENVKDRPMKVFEGLRNFCISA